MARKDRSEEAPASVARQDGQKEKPESIAALKGRKPHSGFVDPSSLIDCDCFLLFWDCFLVSLAGSLFGLYLDS